jgi:hypothetical protein
MEQFVLLLNPFVPVLGSSVVRENTRELVMEGKENY